MSIKNILQKIEADPKLKEAMDVLQLTEKSFRLMPLFPLLYVAWADGKLQQEEVDKILEVAEENGLTEGDGAGILSIWLNPEKRPSDDFFVSGLRLTAAVLKFAQTTYKNNLVQLCESVAEAAGGVFGMSTVSGEEKKALVQVAELLDVRGQASYHTLIERMQAELSPEELEWIPSKLSPAWLGINAVVSLVVSLGIFLMLRSWYNGFVVSETHQTVFLAAFLLLPQIGFFLSNVLTARLSPGNTIRESTIGSAVSVVLVIILGAFVIGSTSKKFQGYNVARPDPTALLFPQCSHLKPAFSRQRCVREAKHDNKDICRLMPNAASDPKKFPVGKAQRDWFPAAACKGEVTSDPLFTSAAKSPKVYKIKTEERLISKGYYQLCSDLKSDAKAACLQIDTHPKEGRACRLASSPSAGAGKEWGTKYVNWFPANRFCTPVFARAYQLWRRKGQSTEFVGFFPRCNDIKVANQECVYVQRMTLPTTSKKERICILAGSRTIPLSAVPLAKEAHQNWFPIKDCQESGSNLPLGLIFAALGFAVFSFFVSAFGGWVGERWQGTV